jgi:hypothetical protein
MNETKFGISSQLAQDVSLYGSRDLYNCVIDIRVGTCVSL